MVTSHVHLYNLFLQLLSRISWKKMENSYVDVHLYIAINHFQEGK